MDPDGEHVSLSVQLGEAMIFTTYQSGILVFKPTQATVKKAYYEITLTLTDSN